MLNEMGRKIPSSQSGCKPNTVVREKIQLCIVCGMIFCCICMNGLLSYDYSIRFQYPTVNVYTTFETHQKQKIYCCICELL